MAYKVIILYQLYMPSYFLGTFTEYPYTDRSEGFFFIYRLTVVSMKQHPKRERSPWDCPNN